MRRVEQTLEEKYFLKFGNMSRIGKKPVVLPAGVSAVITDETVQIKGPKGSLSFTMHPNIEIRSEGNILTFIPRRENRESSKLWGTARAIVANMVEGVINGFEKKLEIEGVGYRAEQKGKDLEFQLGFSHPVNVKAPEGILFKVEKNIITISGISKEEVGRVAAGIRALKKPEPYKGKGIHYMGEVIRRKAGKKATVAG